MSKEKIAITLDAHAIAQVKSQVRLKRAASVSAYISNAVSTQLEADAIARLVEELVHEHAQPSPKAKAWARSVLKK